MYISLMLAIADRCLNLQNNRLSFIAISTHRVYVARSIVISFITFWEYMIEATRECVILYYITSSRINNGDVQLHKRSGNNNYLHHKNQNHVIEKWVYICCQDVDCNMSVCFSQAEANTGLFSNYIYDSDTCDVNNFYLVLVSWADIPFVFLFKFDTGSDKIILEAENIHEKDTKIWNFKKGMARRKIKVKPNAISTLRIQTKIQMEIWSALIEIPIDILFIIEFLQAFVHDLKCDIRNTQITVRFWTNWKKNETRSWPTIILRY